MQLKNDNKIVNISSCLKKMAGVQPYKRAVVYPVGRDKYKRVAYSHLTFQQLDRESDCLAHGLEKAGITRGTRTILMVKPGPEFFSLTFAIFKVGAIPVVVDPGMGIGRMLLCLKESKPDAFIGIPAAHALRVLFPKYFRTVKTSITIGRRWFWGGLTLRHIRQIPWQSYAAAETAHDETAAILFTTGSTGPAKGVVYTHGMFDAQIRHIKSHFNIAEDEIDLPTFPLFALFDPALGMTAVIPDMDPTKPARVNPERIIEAIINQGVTNMFASPALLNRVGRYGKSKGIKLPSLKRVVSAGAPVSPSNIERFSSMLRDDAKIHTPYGATEAVPVISISSSEILSETGKLSEQGFGICVGRVLEGTQVRIIKITDNPIKKWSDSLMVSDNEIGEITVSGDLVTRQYFENILADALSKIKDEDKVWHRMGDLGWMDKKGRIWFCGRKNHRVITEKGTLFTIPCEAIFNNHPRVFRSALVGIGSPPKQRPVICIELEPRDGKGKKKQLMLELFELAKKSALTKDINTILFKKTFPVDIRHNSKIFREKLALWAEKKLAK
ncbi:MAG: AMP-binding protein [Desulfobacteraceae bacterium]|nr:AMP-binding protein [Pseudomonadota bacterium]MBU4462908.1 AMP-binding protein [Pseudomonadota bacterium]MCG2754022.1 AMP-binding protein [Desulfobacteraceae bacterium]